MAVPPETDSFRTVQMVPNLEPIFAEIERQIKAIADERGITLEEAALLLEDEPWRPEYCTQPQVTCEECSLANNGRDCRNVPILRLERTRRPRSIPP